MPHAQTYLGIATCATALLNTLVRIALTKLFHAIQVHVTMVECAQIYTAMSLQLSAASVRNTIWVIHANNTLVSIHK